VASVKKSWGKTLPAFRSIFTYAITLGRTDPKKADQIKAGLERYLIELTKTSETLKGYTEDERKKSNLYKEVTLGFLACEAWMKNIEQNRMPRDIEESLVRKTGRLQNYVTLEIVEKLSEVSIAFNRMVADLKAKGDEKHPYIYYHNGKVYIEQMKWMEAKQSFLNYEHFVQAKDPRVRKPEEDNFYYYLSYIQEQINLQNKEVCDPIVTIVETPDNKYEKKYQQWLKDHPAVDITRSYTRALSSPEKSPARASSGSSGSSSSSGSMYNLISPPSTPHRPLTPTSPYKSPPTSPGGKPYGGK